MSTQKKKRKKKRETTLIQNLSRTLAYVHFVIPDVNDKLQWLNCGPNLGLIAMNKCKSPGMLVEIIFE